MTKLLFVSHTLDFAAGGAERVLLDILKRIDRDRFDISLAAGRDAQGVPAAFEGLDLPVRVLPELPMPSSRTLWGFLRVGFAIGSSALSLWAVLRREPCDLIHVNSVFALHFALLPCLLTHTPLIYHEHGLPRSRESSIWSIAYPWLIHHVVHTIALTDAVRAEVISYDVMPNAVTTVHNGIDPEYPSAAAAALSEAAAPVTMRSSTPGLTIVQIANFLDWKGQDVVLRSLALLRERVPQARVVFFGKSKDLAFESQLHELVDELGLSDCVEFGGYREDLGELLPSFDCLVVASRAEPFGLVLLEAMRASVPIVASNAGGVPEIVSDGVNGLLFEPGDPAGLADALSRIALDDQLAKHLVAEGHRVVQSNFSFSQQVDSLEAIFLACSRRGGPAS